MKLKMGTKLDVGNSRRRNFKHLSLKEEMERGLSWKVGGRRRSEIGGTRIRLGKLSRRQRLGRRWNGELRKRVVVRTRFSSRRVGGTSRREKKSRVGFRRYSTLSPSLLYYSIFNKPPSPQPSITLLENQEDSRRARGQKSRKLFRNFLSSYFSLFLLSCPFFFLSLSGIIRGIPAKNRRLHVFGGDNPSRSNLLLGFLLFPFSNLRSNPSFPLSPPYHSQ